MKFIVDELPDYESDCPFYDLKAGVCKLDGEHRYQYSDPEGCPHLKVLEQKCHITLDYPLKCSQITEDEAAKIFEERMRKYMFEYLLGKGKCDG